MRTIRPRGNTRKPAQPDDIDRKSLCEIGEYALRLPKGWSMRLVSLPCSLAIEVIDANVGGRAFAVPRSDDGSIASHIVSHMIEAATDEVVAEGKIDEQEKKANANKKKRARASK